MSTLKRNKPNGIFVNQYLTKKRSQLLYSLRNIKKITLLVPSYSRYGTVFYKLQGNDKPQIINDTT